MTAVGRLRARIVSTKRLVRTVCKHCPTVGHVEATQNELLNCLKVNIVVKGDQHLKNLPDIYAHFTSRFTPQCEFYTLGPSRID